MVCCLSVRIIDAKLSPFWRLRLPAPREKIGFFVDIVDKSNQVLVKLKVSCVGLRSLGLFSRRQGEDEKNTFKPNQSLSFPLEQRHQVLGGAPFRLVDDGLDQRQRLLGHFAGVVFARTVLNDGENGLDKT